MAAASIALSVSVVAGRVPMKPPVGVNVRPDVNEAALESRPEKETRLAAAPSFFAALIFTIWPLQRVRHQQSILRLAQSLARSVAH